MGCTGAMHLQCWDIPDAMTAGRCCIAISTLQLACWMPSILATGLLGDHLLISGGSSGLA